MFASKDLTPSNITIMEVVHMRERLLTGNLAPSQKPARSQAIEGLNELIRSFLVANPDNG